MINKYRCGVIDENTFQIDRIKKRTTGFFVNRDTTYNFNSSNKDVIDLFHKHKQYKI